MLSQEVLSFFFFFFISVTIQWESQAPGRSYTGLLFGKVGWHNLLIILVQGPDVTKRHFGNGFFSLTHWSFHLFEPYLTVQAFLVEAIDNARLAHEPCWLY